MENINSKKTDVNKINKATENTADKALTPSFKKEEENADAKWEEVKDKTSGVNKDLEKKLEQGTINPKDLSTSGG